MDPFSFVTISIGELHKSLNSSKVIKILTLHVVKYCDWTESLVKFCSRVLECVRFQCCLVAGKLCYWSNIVSGARMCPKYSHSDYSIERVAKVAVEFGFLVEPLNSVFSNEIISRTQATQQRTSVNIASRSFRRLFVRAMSQVCKIAELLNFSIKNLASSTV